ncbi:MAG: DUF2971 domain-containing protein, partial [Ignavibacteria bacterium]|nr:DUF2971 domain-containing protein [Ignavibacteria bacterium]
AGEDVVTCPEYMELFKYTSSLNAERILVNQSIRFTQPLAFNDPFDSNPFVKKLYSIEELKILIDRMFADNRDSFEEVILDSFYNTLEIIYPGSKQLINSEQLLDFFYSNIEKGPGSISNFVFSKPDDDSFLEKTINHFIQNVLTQTGVLSLTTDPRNLLMWAHYGDSHRGIVLEFDGDHPFFDQSDNGIYPKKIETTYSDERPKLDFKLEELSDSDKLFQGFKSIYFTKSIDWKYEAEYRVIRKLSGDTDSGVKDVNGFKIHLFPLPKDVLKGIIFGKSTPKTNIDSILKIMSDMEYHDIAVRQIELDEKNYLLKISDCP